MYANSLFILCIEFHVGRMQTKSSRLCANTDSITNFRQPTTWAVKAEGRHFFTSQLILHLVFDEAKGIPTLQYRLHYNRLYVYGRRIAFVGFLITCSKNHKKFRLFVQCSSDTERRRLLAEEMQQAKIISSILRYGAGCQHSHSDGLADCVL